MTTKDREQALLEAVRRFRDARKNVDAALAARQDLQKLLEKANQEYSVALTEENDAKRRVDVAVAAASTPEDES